MQFALVDMFCEKGYAKTQPLGRKRIMLLGEERYPWVLFGYRGNYGRIISWLYCYSSERVALSG